VAENEGGGRVEEERAVNEQELKRAQSDLLRDQTYLRLAQRAEVVKLRDQCAMAALTGLLAHSGPRRPNGPSPAEVCAEFSEMAYQLADAMLRQRDTAREEE
jgi:hypothetical protein